MSILGLSNSSLSFSLVNLNLLGILRQPRSIGVSDINTLLSKLLQLLDNLWSWHWNLEVPFPLRELVGLQVLSHDQWGPINHLDGTSSALDSLDGSLGSIRSLQGDWHAQGRDFLGSLT